MSGNEQAFPGFSYTSVPLHPGTVSGYTIAPVPSMGDVAEAPRQAVAIPEPDQNHDGNRDGA